MTWSENDGATVEQRSDDDKKRYDEIYSEGDIKAGKGPTDGMTSVDVGR